MLKKNLCAALLVALCCLPESGRAATCRAAEAGSQADYAQAKRATDAWSTREQRASDQLQSCLLLIRTTTIQLPSFLSQAESMNQLSEQVCQAAVDKINGHLPGTLDPWQEFTGQ